MRKARADPPPLFEFDSDDVLITICVRVPFFAHGSLRCCCRRANRLLKSPAFHKQRLDSRYAETALVF